MGHDAGRGGGEAGRTVCAPRTVFRMIASKPLSE
jgi:hypothetical protein